MELPPVLRILISIIVVGIIIFGWWYNSAKQKGKRGEKRIHELLSKLPDEYYILDDVVLKTEKGTTQIDHVVVSKYGIFAIETKNYSGEIYGDDNRQQWTQIIASDVTYSKKWWKTYTYVTKNQFYNPVKQSWGHVYELKKNLPEWSYIKIVPIVVFTGSAILKGVSSKNHVIYDEELLATIQDYKTVCLSDADVEKVVKHLVEKNVRDEVDNKTHVRHVKKVKKEVESKMSSEKCPQCGGNLVLRNGRFGSFYGCSNYPRCKFTTH